MGKLGSQQPVSFEKDGVKGLGSLLVCEKLIVLFLKCVKRNMNMLKECPSVFLGVVGNRLNTAVPVLQNKRGDKHIL